MNKRNEEMVLIEKTVVTAMYLGDSNIQHKNEKVGTQFRLFDKINYMDENSKVQKIEKVWVKNSYSLNNLDLKKGDYIVFDARIEKFEDKEGIKIGLRHLRNVEKI